MAPLSERGSRLEENALESTKTANWIVPVSRKAIRCSNPIRKFIEGYEAPRCGKEVISLSIGDPTKYENIRTPELLTQAVAQACLKGNSNGYQLSSGSLSAREAIANKYSTPASPLAPSDVYICSGCSGGLEMVLSTLLNEGDDNVLIPQPGFPLYKTIVDGIGARCRYYNLMPEQNWEVDLSQMESQINERTRAILINNPSNPCGSVFSEEHLRAIIALAEAHHLPIIADEIYGDMVYDTKTPFIPLATLSQYVPVITCGGIAKSFLVPGWRVGWICLHDRHKALSEVRGGIANLCGVSLGANSLVQAALPAVLTPATEEAQQEISDFSKKWLDLLRSNADLTVKRLGEVPGLRPVRAAGAMYTMVAVDVSMLKGINNAIDFVKQLLDEESIILLPGECFGIENHFRCSISAPATVLEEAFGRIDQFCRRRLLNGTAVV